MNKNAKQVYDILLHKPSARFDMSQWAHRCGTPSCVGGTAEFCMRGEIARLPNSTPSYEIGAWLGLTPELSDALFFPGLYSNLPAIWDHVPSEAGRPINLIGKKGARFAAEALRRACNLSNKIRRDARKAGKQCA